MAGRDLAKILIHRQGVIDGTSYELSMKTNFGVDVGVKVKAQPVAHARVLLMRQRAEVRGRRRIGLAKDAIKAQTEVAAEAKWPETFAQVIGWSSLSGGWLTFGWRFSRSWHGALQPYLRSIY